jgi:hypothetical protein
MKKIVLAIVAVITMSATVMAQEENKPMRDHQRPDMKEMVKQRTSETVKTYGLNEAQAAQLLELNLQYADKIRPMGGPNHRGGRNGHRPHMNRNGKQQGDTLQAQRQPQRPSREEMEKRREEMMKNMDAYNAELQKIMTEDQFKAYQADIQKRMKNGPRGPRE